MKFKDLVVKLGTSEEELKRVIDTEKDDDSKISNYKKEIDGNKKRQEVMKKENLDKFKDKIGNAEKVLNAEKKVSITVEAKLNTAKMDVDDAKKKLVEAEKAKKQQEKELQDYKKKSSTTVGEFEAVKAQIATAQDELNKAREQENSLKMGKIVDEEGNACDARQELMRKFFLLCD
jgi:chromosome segregation ATPase